MRLGRRHRDGFRQWETGVFGPRIVGWRAQELEYHGNELNLGLGLKQRLLQQKFCEYTPDGPHVNGR